jgi:hypothetical protein
VTRFHKARISNAPESLENNGCRLNYTTNGTIIAILRDALVNVEENGLTKRHCVFIRFHASAIIITTFSRVSSMEQLWCSFTQ